ncbi:uncharacterized protein LOC131642295 [Vicia villosa]|uniref:uncharacterized protein LOC131642295 n=1 Tax=Vicia villosa TaxID=3911 RepID=UPI00273A9BBC|nr:uncharacterized protein LOC131642295 [Vicia villosa]
MEERRVATDQALQKALSCLWSIKVPSNTTLFGWRYLTNRLPTKVSLHRRGISLDRTCVLCELELESSSHLFGSCVITEGVWKRIKLWLGNDLDLSKEELQNFFHHWNKLSKLKTRITVAIVWLATMWSLWLVRNEIVFSNSEFSFNEIMTVIVSRSWYWMSAYVTISTGCSSYMVYSSTNMHGRWLNGKDLKDARVLNDVVDVPIQEFDIVA